jgi:hypothetical protein
MATLLVLAISFCIMGSGSKPTVWDGDLLFGHGEWIQCVNKQSFVLVLSPPCGMETGQSFFSF